MGVPCRAMVTKNFLKSAAACRELFFSGDLPQELLERYQGLLKEHASAVSVINVCASPSRLRRCSQETWPLSCYDTIEAHTAPDAGTNPIGMLHPEKGVHQASWRTTICRPMRAARPAACMSRRWEVSDLVATRAETVVCARWRA